MKKSTLVIIFWLVGVLFGLLAIVKLTYEIPKLESSINENEEKISIEYLNIQRYEFHQASAENLQGVLAILKKMGVNENDSDYSELGHDLTFDITSTIGILHTLKDGTNPTPEQTTRWNSMSRSDQIDEQNRSAHLYLEGDDQLSKLKKTREYLETKRSNVIKWTIILQILSMIFVQLGNILEFRTHRNW